MRPTLLSVLTAASLLQATWPPANPPLAISLLLLLIVQFKLVHPTPALRAHALKSATLGVFLQAVTTAGVLLQSVAILLALLSFALPLLVSMLIEPDVYDYLTEPVRNLFRNLLSVRVDASPETLMSVASSVVLSVMHGFTALALTSDYSSLLLVPGGGRDGAIAVRSLRIDDVLRFGWTGAVGMQTSKTIFYAWIQWRWMFFPPIGVILDAAFELVAVGVWQTWVSLAVATRDVLGGRNAVGSVILVCVLRTCLDLTSLLGLRGEKWETAAALAGVGQVGLMGLLCWRRYRWCQWKAR